MMSRKKIVVLFLCFTCCLCYGTRYADGRFASWLPYSDLDVAANAAFTYSGTPIVLFDPRALRNTPDPVVNFYLLREEYIALIAKEQRDNKKIDVPANKKFLEGGSPYTIVDEISVYTYISSDTVTASRRLDCLAYDSLSQADRYHFFQYVRNELLARRRFITGSLGRSFTRGDLDYIISKECSDFHMEIDLKLNLKK